MTIPLVRRPPARQHHSAAEAEASASGQWTQVQVAGQVLPAFVPDPLPSTPPSEEPEALQARRDTASTAMGQLQGLVSALDEAPAVVRHALRREAVASTLMAGEQTSMAEYLLYEVDDSPMPSANGAARRATGAAAAASALAALDLGLARAREGESPGRKLLQELHGELSRHQKRRRQQVGRFRRESVALDGYAPDDAAHAFVPPPPSYVGPCIDELERYLGDDSVPWLSRAVLGFGQLLCIHPFPSANARLARVTLMLMLQGQPGRMGSPLAQGLTALAPSVSLLREWDAARDSLARLRMYGDYEGWMRFMFARLTEAAEETTVCLHGVRALFERDRERIEWLGRSAQSALRLHGLLLDHPVISIPDAARTLDLTQPTVGKSVEHLRGLGILREITGRERRRLFAYDEFIHMLEPTTHSAAQH